ncbi:MAG: DUF3047 domain-containing protein [Rhodospirillales bacterium]|nr:DUF3047 domain-containing protein [Rhodospirillales bacterium]
MGNKLAHKALCLCFTAIILTGCGHPTTSISPEGKLTVLELTKPNQTINSFEDNWIFRGVVFNRLVDNDVRALQLIKDGGVKALQIKRIDSDFLMVRKTSAQLVASPYLSWTWKTNGPPPPFRIVIGFKGGNQKADKWSLSSMGSSFPEFDRSITIVVKKEINRNTIVSVQDKRAQIIYGVAPYLAGIWKTEVLDLHELYARLWPGDRLGKSKVAFIGISVNGADNSQTALLKSIFLSR